MMKNKILLLAALFSIFILPASAETANKMFQTYGDIGQIALPLTAAVWTLAEKDYKGTLQLCETGAFGQGITLLLKNTIKEERPNGASQSFPSGHTMAAFTGAAFLDQRYDIKSKYWFYGAAALVGISRVTSKSHWPHDVIAGALLGYYSDKIFVKPFQNKNLSFLPIIDSRGFYAEAYYKF